MLSPPMEIADFMTVLLLAMIVALFWAIIPGLIAGWILREGGRSFGWGCALGVLCGPLGVLAALLIVSLSSRGARQAIAHTSSSTNTQTPCSYYELPLLGRLHVSTVGALAGVATFACVWVIGGLAFELYRLEINKQDEADRVINSPTSHQPQTSSDNNTNQRSLPQAAPTESISVAGETLASGRPTTFADLASRSTRPAQTSINAGLPSAMSEEARPVPNAGTSVNADTRLTGAANQSPEVLKSANPQNIRPAQQARDGIISEVTQSLGAQGYRVHAAISGDAQTATLSLSSAGLTRAAGNSLLGNTRLRAAMRAAGIRIVVIINGQESWTYML